MPHPDYEAPLGTCETCKWFSCIEMYQGFCRRNPPVPKAHSDNSPPLDNGWFGVWPETGPMNWCGEYAPKAKGE